MRDSVIRFRHARSCRLHAQHTTRPLLSLQEPGGAFSLRRATYRVQPGVAILAVLRKLLDG